MEYDNFKINQKLEDGTHVFGFKSEPPLTPVAPSYAYYFTEKKIFSEEECKEWNDYLLKQEQTLLDKFRNAVGAGGTGLSATSITSRYPYFNLLNFDFHLVEQLKTKVFDGIRSILSISDNTNWRETLYANCWFNVLRKEEGMNTHSHGYHKDSFYGFHLTTGAKETFTSYYHPIKFQDDAFHVPNKIGYLTLFPIFIPHGVTPNKYESPRISIAGDIFASTRLNEPDPPYNIKNLIEIGKLQETK
jgi:hypothetical protein